MNDLPPPVSRAAALALLLLLLFVLVIYGIAPLTGFYRDRFDKVEQLSTQLSRYRYLIKNEARIDEELKKINETGDSELFLRGNKVAIASANLREFITEAVQKSGGLLVSSQDYESEQLPDAAPVGLRVQISGEVGNLVDLLYRLESAQPLIFIDQLTVTSSSVRSRSSRSRRQARNASRVRHSLDIRMDLVGYMGAEAS